MLLNVSMNGTLMKSKLYRCTYLLEALAESIINNLTTRQTNIMFTLIHRRNTNGFLINRTFLHW